MNRLAQTARALTSGSDWNSYAASQVAAREEFIAGLDAAEARNARCEAMLDYLAAGLIAGMDEGTS